MGVRPPQNDLEDEPDTVEFGIAALDAYLERSDLTFPADAEEVVGGLGDPKIDLDPTGNAVPLSRVVADVDRERFDSRRDLLDALHPEFERRRRQTGGSFFDWLRTLLPGS
jgi:hypothetical protein